MKHISLILGVYLVALAIIPCADGAAWDQHDMDQSLEAEWTGEVDHDHDDTMDLCSPLCMCSCCHITIRPPMKLDWQLGAPPLVLAKAPTLPSEVWDFVCLDDIWQPPKFS